MWDARKTCKSSNPLLPSTCAAPKLNILRLSSLSPPLDEKSSKIPGFRENFLSYGRRRATHHPQQSRSPEKSMLDSGIAGRWGGTPGNPEARSLPSLHSAVSPGIFSHSLLKSKLNQYTNQMVLPIKQLHCGKRRDKSVISWLHIGIILSTCHQQYFCRFKHLTISFLPPSNN